MSLLNNSRKTLTLSDKENAIIKKEKENASMLNMSKKKQQERSQCNPIEILSGYQMVKVHPG